MERAEERARSGDKDTNEANDLAQAAKIIAKIIWFLIKAAVIILVLFLIAVWYLLNQPAAFDERAITSIKEEIRASYKRKDFIVHELLLIKENSRKLSGYISISSSNNPNRLSLTCGATMGEDGQSFWQCGQ